MRRNLIGALAAAGASVLMAAPVAQADGPVQAGVAVLDGTYHVGNSAGQYATTRDQGYGPVDPHAQQVKNQASYGVQARESVRALVVKAHGSYIALVSDDHYIPQDALWRRTAQLLEADTHGAIGTSNLIMSVTHNHSSPSYSSFDWGVWSFQDVFGFRFFDYYAHQNAAAVEQAMAHLHGVRVSATVSHFDAFQKNPMGPTTADDGTPAGFPRPHTDHDLSVVHFQNIDDPANPQPLATLINIGQHPEDLMGYNLISGEYPSEMERMVDRTVGGTTIMTQNAIGTSEVEEDRWHPIHNRELFNHAQYNQMEWAARQLADAVIADVNSIRAQQPNPDISPQPYGGTSYHDRFVPWMTHFPVAMDNRWFGGPISHPYPGVSSCRTDAAFQGDPRLPVVGLPNCQDMPWGTSLQPVTTLGGMSPGLSTSTFTALGIPVPANYSAPSTGGLEDTVGVHMQAVRMGDILFTICSCEQWVEQSWNIKTRTDNVPGNEYLGYDATKPLPDPREQGMEQCTKNGDGTYADDGSGTGTWTCRLNDVWWHQTFKLSDKLIEHMRAQVLNDATGWDDPTCRRIGCGAQAESEPANNLQIYGNFTHDDTSLRDVHGGHSQRPSYARRYGYKMTVTIAMANDYNGYIASYREYMDRDHYRKALTGWGPHSSDYYATRLVQMGHELKGDGTAHGALDSQTEPGKASPGWASMVAKEVVDQRHDDVKVQAISEAASAGVAAYDKTVPDDGAGVPADTIQPKDIERFDASTFTWVGGNNYTDNPYVTLERCTAGCGDPAHASWTPFADQSGEIPVVVHYPASSSDPQSIASGMVLYHLGGQVWKWTATFEAFVSRFPLVDPHGQTYQATPVGTYRFVVHGKVRQGGQTADYQRVSDPFRVMPWTGITVTGLKLDPTGHLAFTAGPTHQIAERTVRNTARPPFHADGSPNPNDDPVTFTIGPVDFPDTVKDPAATGAAFLNPTRGYSGTSPDNVEHYCLDCTFRPWMDATDDLAAHVTITRAGGTTATEDLKPDANGNFASSSSLSSGDSATVSIDDAWGDTVAAPAAITG
jgi:hypothetical protein